jgi:hypothetical protein
LPTIQSISTSVPEEHAGVPTMLKHLEPDQAPTTDTSVTFSIAPSMQTIVIDCELVVNPKLAPVVGNNTVSVISCPEDSHASRPTRGEMITPGETMPSTIRVPMVDHVTPTSRVRPATVQVGATTTLAEVETVLPEITMAINHAMGPPPPCTHNSPSMSGVATLIPEKHASSTAVLKHLKPHEIPSSTKMPVGFSITPAVQAIIIDRIPVVDPQLAAIIGQNTKPIMARIEDSHASCPTRSEMIASMEARPMATCVPVVYSMTPTLHIGPA